MMNDDYNEKETVSAGSSQDISDFPEGFEAFDEAEDEIGEVEDLPEAEAETGAEEDLPEAVEETGAEEDLPEAVEETGAEEDLPEAVEETVEEEDIPEAEAETEAEDIPETELETEAGDIPEAELETEAEDIPEAELETEAEGIPEAELETEAEEDLPEAVEETVEEEDLPEAEAETEAEDLPEAEAETEAEEDLPEAEAETEAEDDLSETVEETGAEDIPETEAETEAEDIPEAEAESVAEDDLSETVEETGAEDIPETEAETEAEDLPEAEAESVAEEDLPEAEAESVAEEESPEQEKTPASERITALADDISSALNSLPEETLTDEGALHDSLSLLADELSDAENEDNGDDDYSPEYEDIADAMRRQNKEADAYQSSVEETEDEDEPVRIYVKDKGENVGTVLEDMFVIDGAGEAPAPAAEETDLSLLTGEAEEDEIGHTQVFEPVSVPSDIEQDEAFAGEYRKKRKKKYSFSKGMVQIAGLLIIVAGLAWVLSKATLSVNGEKDVVSADEYNYSSSRVVIKPFVDDSDEEPVVVPPFTVEKLKIGDKGDMVVAVQRTLASLGYLSAGKVSGMYDNATGEAVRQFQKANLLAVTGEVDKETYELIFDSSAVTPTTKTTDLPTTTEAETQPTQAETNPVSSETEETKADVPVSDESSMSEPVSSIEEKKPEEESSADAGDKTGPEDSTTTPATSEKKATDAESAEVAVG